jgi:diketogulonate reductase-like aldo/keto reductase
VSRLQLLIFEIILGSNRRPERLPRQLSTLSRRRATATLTAHTVRLPPAHQGATNKSLLGYGNEAEVGQGIDASGVPRSELFITGKREWCCANQFSLRSQKNFDQVWSTYHTRVEEQLDITLKDLGTDYVDLFLIHCTPSLPCAREVDTDFLSSITGPVALNPNGNDRMFPRLPDGTRDRTPEQTIEKTWASMEAVLKTGKARAIGLSNSSIPIIERVLKSGTVKPAALQGTHRAATHLPCRLDYDIHGS